MSVEEEYTLIRISKLSKEKLDNLKIIKGEPYHSVFGDLIEFGEKYNFKSIRMDNLKKNMEVKNEGKIKVKQKANS